ncbi:TIM barrel protein [Arthrobacter sp. NPDC090010]|uniref:TIM barrel protein n=1 Tax=Arthrobacter sp. NPDC090010 TaxID=3363942 RepID=UPI00382EF74D
MTQITSTAPGGRLRDASAATPVRLGAQFGRYPGQEEQPLEDSVRAAILDGFGLVVLNSIAPELAAGEHEQLKRAAELAADHGVELQLGLGSAGPFGGAHHTRHSLGAALAHGLELGIREFFVHTRSEREGTWEGGRFLDHSAQLRLIRSNLESLTAQASGAGARINLKTHEDLASNEVQALVESLDPAVFSIGLDVANLVVRGEDPQAATQRLALMIRMTHLEDLVLFPVEHGYRRRLRPIGDGVLDWTPLLSTLLDAGVRDFTLEQHRGKFDTPVFERSWFEHEPHLDAADLGQLSRLGVLTADGVAQGRIPALTDWDEDPSPAERRRQLLRSATALRTALAALGASVTDPAALLSREEGIQ